MNAPQVGQRRNVTAFLVDAGVVTEAQVEAGLVRQRETRRRIGESLVELGFVWEEDIAWALARQLGLTFVDVRGETLDPVLVQSFPEALLRRLQFVPSVHSEDRLVVAAADPTDNDAMREMEDLAGTRVECVSATARAIARALDNVLDGSQSFDQALFGLYHKGEITLDEALRQADSANNLRLRIKMSAGAAPVDKPQFAIRKNPEEEGWAA